MPWCSFIPYALRVYMVYTYKHLHVPRCNTTSHESVVKERTRDFSSGGWSWATAAAAAAAAASVSPPAKSRW
ncbi:hypothetical protein M0802_001801 [Mischocyttarus mexicanus]|nr:hypothetical protein M0802_001801 [Mischocyttarus mexicanus]